MLVFDLGGGTFDVSLLSIDSGVFEVCAGREPRKSPTHARIRTQPHTHSNARLRPCPDRAPLSVTETVASTPVPELFSGSMEHLSRPGECGEHESTTVDGAYSGRQWMGPIQGASEWGLFRKMI